MNFFSMQEMFSMKIVYKYKQFFWWNVFSMHAISFNENSFSMQVVFLNEIFFSMQTIFLMKEIFNANDFSI